ncbi:urease accessory protein UreF [Sphingomonas sp. LY54]|uniref:urease accessory protein UreF n=1 Tax=Sphingomonas sp. LY54 TaxID=3095343 RepID=UPI002D7A4047|nr:urease accessory protein UreF [Sphingomonas sp. LY54]WRP27732.1 urease accessory protein UreF [Sphingomonas sp. LY54]
MTKMDISASTVEPRAPGMALSHEGLVKLQTWFSPAFPIGAFSYSHGLERAVEVGDVQTARSLADWIEGLLRYGAGRSDAIILCEIWRAVMSLRWADARETAELAAALQPSAERRLESLSQGAAFQTAVRAAWPHAAIDEFAEACPVQVALPVACGVASAAHELPLEAVIVAYLHAFAANLVAAGVRLVPLGQTDGLRVSAELEPTILAIADEAMAADREDIGSACILADISSMLHETQYTRLFRS